MRQDLKDALKKSVKGYISFNEALRNHTTFKIGGRVEAWVEPRSLEDLKRALKLFSEMKLEPLVIGMGSNILASDGMIKKAFIKLSSPYFKRLEFNRDCVIARSGLSLSRLLSACIEKGLSGLEMLAGIPGSAGGAIMMNAGGSGKNNIKDAVEWVRAIDYKGRRVSLFSKKNRLRFDYRQSNLSKFIILEAKFALKRRSPKVMRKIYAQFLKRKRSLQEYRYPNAGCIFKNPKDSNLTSGQILDLCGFKGVKIKDAVVSRKHANFIINKGNARFKDVIALMELEQKIVRRKYGISLEPEITIVR